MSGTSVVMAFEVYRGEWLLKNAEFQEESITIGSGEAALLRIDDPSVAELHAVLNVEHDGTVQLLDLGSETGTFLNGERVSNGTIASGSLLDVGELRIQIRITHIGGEVDEDDEATFVARRPENLSKIVEGALPAASMASDIGGPAHEAAPSMSEPQMSTDSPLPPDASNSPEEPEEQTEDVMDFVIRAGTAKSNAGIDRKAPKVLEVNQIWGQMLLDTKHFRKGRPAVTIGAKTGYKWHFLGVEVGWVPTGLAMILPFTPPMWSEVTNDFRNDFYASNQDMPKGEDHSLFTWEKGAYVADVYEQWDGFVDIEDQRYSFDELVASGKAEKRGQNYRIPLNNGVRLMVDVNGVIFFSHMVHPGKRFFASILDAIDFLFLGILALAAFIGIMFGMLIWFIPNNPNLEVMEIDERFVELMLEKQEKLKEDKPSANPDAGEGKKAKREEGKTGKKDAKMKKAKGKKLDQQKIDRQIAESAGVLGALRNEGMMDGFGGAIDPNLVGGIGGLIGAKGTQIGAGGLGSRGGGLGGGGSAEGLGGLGTKGIGSGASGYGSQGGNFGKKGSGAIGRVGGDPIILGALDRSLIDEVIKRHMNQIRYCYQRELTKSPSLAGKIVVKFVIAKDGSVSSASVKSSTMKNGTVEGCIVSRFKRMQFPTPKGGGIVIVSYPFLFAPG